jgi:hypothetical protein
MENYVQGIAELYLSKQTNLNMEQFESKFHEDSIIKATLQLIMPNGTTENIDVIDFIKLHWLTFEDKENH